MASVFDSCVGHCYYVFGFCEELQGVYGCESYSWIDRGWIVTWHGKSEVCQLSECQLISDKVLYLSGMYTRGEMALRLGLFYTAASLSGAFGGMFLSFEL
jgi:hypothetical protein